MRISRTQPNHSTHTSCEQPTQLKNMQKIYHQHTQKVSLLQYFFNMTQKFLRVTSTGSTETSCDLACEVLHLNLPATG
jgi:hypothetical protein